jgi:hypothetical protein
MRAAASVAALGSRAALGLTKPRHAMPSHALRRPIGPRSDKLAHCQQEINHA